ncbi:hypothetical protein BHE74_00018240 [Ensete ventricosum]|nr:hypothetical protein BHE74_00018240 [Ensete ventricosum]
MSVVVCATDEVEEITANVITEGRVDGEGVQVGRVDKGHLGPEVAVVGSKHGTIRVDDMAILLRERELKEAFFILTEAFDFGGPLERDIAEEGSGVGGVLTHG